MPSIWPCGGFGWLALRRRGSPVPETTSYSSDDSGAVNTINYSDSTPAQPIEIDQLVQSAQLTPATSLRCRSSGPLIPPPPPPPPPTPPPPPPPPPTFPHLH